MTKHARGKNAGPGSRAGGASFGVRGARNAPVTSQVARGRPASQKRGQTPGRAGPPSQDRGRTPTRGPPRGPDQSRGRNMSRDNATRGRSIVRSENGRPRKPMQPFRTDQGEAPIARDANAIAPNRVTTVLTTKSPMVVGSPLHSLCGLLVAKYDSLCPGKMGPLLTPADGISYEPVQLLGCLLLVCASYFKKAGVFTNQTLLAALSEIPADTPVPTALAKMLQYYAPFTSQEGVEFDCQDNTAAIPAVTTANGTVTTTGANWLDKAVVNITPCSGATGNFELSSAAGAAIVNMASLTAAFGSIMDQFGSSMPCIPFSKIPLNAPDASVHANVDTTAFIATSAAKAFDPEVALLLCESNVNGNTIWGSHRRPLPNVGSPGTSRGLLNVQTGQGGLLIGWVETLARCKWSNGTIKTMLASCDLGKLTSFCVELFDMDMRNWHRLVVAQILQIAGDYDDDHDPTTAQAALSELDAHVIATLLESALIARLGEFTHLSFPVHPCRAYDNTLKSLQLPPWVGVFLWALGPVIREGRLRLVLPFNTTSNHWTNYCGKSYLQIGNGDQGCFQGLFATLCSNSVVINNIDLTAVINTTAYCLTPIKFSQLYEGTYNAAMGYTKANVARGITADLNKTLGAVPNLAYVNYATTSTVVVDNLILKITPSGTAAHATYAWAVTAVTSDAPLSRSDVMLSAFLGVISAPPIGSQSNRLMSYVTQLGNVLNLVPTLVASQDGDDFTQSLGAVRAQVAQYYSVHGQSMDLKKQGNAMITALASVAGPILANLMPQVASWAIGKTTGLTDPSAKGDVFSDFGTIVRDGSDLFNKGKSLYTNAQKMGLVGKISL